MIKESNTHCH